jgi:cytochrome c
MTRWAAFVPAALLAVGSLSCARDEPAPPPVPFYPSYPTTAVPEPSSSSPPAVMADSGAPEFSKCAPCHSIGRDEPNGIGPNLYGVFDRRAATARPEYSYSPQLRQSGLVWDSTTLDRFLAGPRELVPGTKMIFRGLEGAERRKAVIAFLRSRSDPRP